MKKRIYCDMDGVLCNFYDAWTKALHEHPEQKYPQAQWGFFLKLAPIEDAIYSFNLLKEHYDVWILTRPSINNVNCYTEKAQWICDYLGQEQLNKTIFACDKSVVKGKDSYLIDDQIGHGQEEFEGELIRFGSTKFKNWIYITRYLLLQK